MRATDHLRIVRDSGQDGFNLVFESVPTAEHVVELFNTNVLPLPFTNLAQPREVLDTVRQRYPYAKVYLSGSR